MKTSDTYMKNPCADCPWRKDSKIKLAKGRAKELLQEEAFVCHKAFYQGGTRIQCAGHMILAGSRNIASRMVHLCELPLEGKELVFDSIEDAINHHDS